MSLRPCASSSCSVSVIPVDAVNHKKPRPYSMVRAPQFGHPSGLREQKLSRIGTMTIVNMSNKVIIADCALLSHTMKAQGQRYAKQRKKPK